MSLPSPQTPNKKLLSLLAKPHLTSREVEIAEELCGQIDNWQPFSDDVFHHRLTPIVYHNSKEINAFPETIRTGLRDSVYLSNAYNLKLSSGLLHVTNVFSRNSISAVHLKGAVLALQAYNDISFRMYSDIDILIAEKDVLAVRDLLADNGWEPRTDIPLGFEEEYLRSENFLEFYHEVKKVSLDLHWELTGRYATQFLYIEQLSENLSEVNVFGHPVCCLSVEAAIVYHCIHAASHCWDTLEMISCLSGLVKQNPGLDWNTIFRLSDKVKSKRMVYCGLTLTSKLFHTVLPTHVEQVIKKDKHVSQLADRIINQLLCDQSDNVRDNLNWRFSLFHLSIRDSCKDSFAYLLRILFRPTCKDWSRWSFGKHFSFLYSVLRPARLMSEFIRK